MDRTAWIKQRRRINEMRMDTLFAPTYDEHWGAVIDPTHRQMLDHFLACCPSAAYILDAACGTGKYWPLLLERGHSILGVDQSQGMLHQAQAKFPAIRVEKRGLQELDYEQAFDGIICIDAMENIFPEDWPIVLVNFQHALKPNGALYFTVEIPEEDISEVFQAAVEAGLPVVEGEYVKEGSYHYYPDIYQVRLWIDTANFEILEEIIGDGYQHFFTQRRD